MSNDILTKDCIGARRFVPGVSLGVMVRHLALRLGLVLVLGLGVSVRIRG